MVRFAAFLSALFVLQTAQADGWPQFRGPTGQGISTETDLPVHWSRTDNVTWTVQIPGEGWSSPILCDGRIYLTTAVPQQAGESKDYSLRCLCLEAATGRILWNKQVFDQQGEKTPGIHSKNSHASPTPMTDGEHIFVHFGTNGTACLTTDGQIVWKTRKLKYDPRHGNGGSPVLVDDVLVVSCDGADVQYVVALDESTGKIRWKKSRPQINRPRKFSFSTPLVIEVDGQQQIVSPGTNHVVAYHPQDGRTIWRFDYSGYSVVPRPVYAHGLLFLSTGFDRPSLLAIRPTGEGNVTETHLAWKSRRAVPHTPSMLVVGEELYFVSDRGIASCLDAKTGTVHWQERLGGNYSASPVFADGHIYFQSEDGTATVIEAGIEYRQVARNQLEERTLASYAVDDSALFIRTAERLYRIEK